MPEAMTSSPVDREQVLERKKRTKADITERISEKLRMNEEVVYSIVNELLLELKVGIGQNKTIELRGLGTFEIRKRSGRDKARNPKTGMPAAVGVHGVVAFRPGRELKKYVWLLRGKDSEDGGG